MLPGELLAAEDDSHYALLSDTHIAADEKLIFNEVDLAAHLRLAISEVMALKNRPAGVFLNGDCALKDGQEDDYTTVTNLLNPLMDGKYPLHMTLGNHDHREHFWNALAKGAAHPVQSKHVSLIESTRANWILLDSLDKTNVTPGLLDKEQRDWLTKTLDANSHKPALVMVHHNPDVSSLLDTKELFEILTPRKQVKALIFGHTHRWQFTEKDGIHLINLPAIAYPFAKEQPTGWTDCFLQENGASFQLNAHDKAHIWHGQKKELIWR